MRKRRWLIGGALALVALAVGIGVYVRNETQPLEKRGSPKTEFEAAEKPRPPVRRVPAVPWPTYGLDHQRSRLAVGFTHRPPYRRIWFFDAGDTLEYPPSIGYGRVYLAQQKGAFYILSAKDGRVLFKKNFRRCSASSPTIAGGLVYQGWMDFVNCPQDRPGASGFLTAMDARTGRERWRFGSVPVESTPLVVGRVLYVGIEDSVYALDARTGRRLWRFKAEGEVNTSPAYWRGRIYIASDAGRVYALGARSGRMLWSAASKARFGSREFFYATPTVAYGRVYIGNTDGTMYAYGARSGELRWARPLGTYIYGAAAAAGRRIFVGTYSGDFFALDAATGDVRWKRPAAAAVHGAPTVMNGLVYYATCSSCGRLASRYVKPGPDGTNAVRAADGRRVWSFPDGKFANPVVADTERIFVTGRAFLHAFDPVSRRPERPAPRAATPAPRPRTRAGSPRTGGGGPARRAGS